MNETDRLNLKRMINENNVEDQTEHIRKTKHSNLIRKETQQIVDLRNQLIADNKYDIDDFSCVCRDKFSFLFFNYTDIFNKVVKDEISIDILNKFLDVLLKVENCELDQHEASFHIGKYLKELYIDSAVKKADKLDKKYETEQPPKPVHQNLSWLDYKSGNLTSSSP